MAKCNGKASIVAPPVASCVVAQNWIAMPKNKAFSDPRGEEIRIKTGKYAGLAAWKDSLREHPPKQVYVIVEVPKFGYVTGIRIAKSSITKVTEIKNYEDLILQDPTVYKAFRAAAKAIAKCDIPATDYLVKLFKDEVDAERKKASERGDWYGNLRDKKGTVPLSAHSMTDM